MSNESVRILVVDDFEPFRDVVCSMLREHSEFQVIAEASDGLAAVQKAEELQPDLILLDIGLPKLDGIEAARGIRKLSPNSKIIFVSQASSVDVVRTAFATGACGYVVKADAVCELLTTINTVLRGQKCVSSRLVEIVVGFFQSQEKTARHEALFYSDDECFLDGFTQFIGGALKAGNVVIVVATKSHRDSLLLRLQARGVNVVGAIAQGRYISLDAADTLSTFMVNGMPDPVRFLKAAGDLIVGAAKAVKGEYARVAACGECAPLLWAQGNAEAAIQVEHLWNELATTYDVEILCGYPLASFHGEQDGHILLEICAKHSAVRSS